MQIKITDNNPRVPVESCTFAHFAAANADGIDAAELAEIAATLQRGEVYRLAVHCGFALIERVESLQVAAARFLQTQSAFDASPDWTNGGNGPDDTALCVMVERMRGAANFANLGALRSAAEAFLTIWDSLQTDGPCPTDSEIAAIRAALDAELASMPAAGLNDWYASIVGYRPQEDSPSMPDAELRALCLGYLAESVNPNNFA